MKRAIAAILFCLLATMPASAEKIVIWKYHTRESFDKAYDSTIRAISLARFVVRSNDKQQGTIHANLMCWGGIGGEYGAVLIIVRKEQEGAYIEATFTKHGGGIGTGPQRWANDLAKGLKEELPDITIEIEKP